MHSLFVLPSPTKTGHKCTIYLPTLAIVFCSNLINILGSKLYVQGLQQSSQAACSATQQLQQSFMNLTMFFHI